MTSNREIALARLRLDLEWDAEASVWVCTSPDVPGLVIEGETLALVGAKCDLIVPDLLAFPRPMERGDIYPDGSA